MADSRSLRDKIYNGTYDLTLSLGLHRENLQYRAEGNSSLVVRLIKENCILRIPKIDGEETEIISSEEGSDFDVEDEGKGCQSQHSAVDEALRVLRMRKAYAQRVLKPLLGDVYIPHMEIVHLTKEDIQSVNAAVDKQRPVFRRHKGLSVLGSGCYALLMPDLCTSLYPNLNPKRSTISIEIKPKQGFVNSKEFFLNELDQNLVNNFNICKFCLKQFLKVQEGRYKYQSKFCPLDLYSGCDIRMKGALRELLRNPQNNLRIFKKVECGLTELWNHLSKCIINKKMAPTYTIEEELIHLVFKALKWCPNELKNIPLASPNPQSKRTFPFQQCYYAPKNCADRIKCDVAACCKHSLPVGCVLDCILRVQTLGGSSLETVLPYSQYCDSPESAPFRNASRYLSASSNGHIYPATLIPKYAGSLEPAFDETQSQFYKRKIWEYLVSLTAKDCSIIISLEPLSQKLENKYEERVLRGTSGVDYFTRVQIVDLDPKPVRNIPKNYEANKKLVNAYVQHQRGHLC